MFIHKSVYALVKQSSRNKLVAIIVFTTVMLQNLNSFTCRWAVCEFHTSDQ